MPEPAATDRFARAVPPGRGAVDDALVTELAGELGDLSRWQLQQALGRAEKLFAAAGVGDVTLHVPDELREQQLRRRITGTLRRFPRAPRRGLGGLCAGDCYDAAHDTVGRVISEHPGLPGRLADALSPGVPAAGDWPNWARLLRWMAYHDSFDAAESARILRRDLARKPMR